MPAGAAAAKETVSKDAHKATMGQRPVRGISPLPAAPPALHRRPTAPTPLPPTVCRLSAVFLTLPASGREEYPLRRRLKHFSLFFPL